MNETTYDRRVAQLIKDVENHPHKDEILCLAQEQLEDDQYKLLVPYAHTCTD